MNKIHNLANNIIIKNNNGASGKVKAKVYFSDYIFEDLPEFLIKYEPDLENHSSESFFDEEVMTVDELYNLIKTSVLKKLDEIGISYITEFSGRRGIHVWIIFEEKISKKIGYSIIQELVKDLSFDESKFGLDKNDFKLLP